MSPTRSLRRRRTVAALAALVLPFALLGPLAPTASAKPDRPVTPTAAPSAPTSGSDRAGVKARATAAAKQLKADRRLVAKAPSGMTRFVLWLESIGARQQLGPITTSRVKADVRQLDKLSPKAVKELSKMSDAHAQQLLLAVVRSEMAPAFEATHRHLTGDNGFFFFVNLQRQLERMGRAAGSTGTVSFLPSKPSRKKVLTQAQQAREFHLDQDGDGVSDAFDDDIDGTGGKNGADAADNVFGIPDEFLVRTPFVAGPVTTDQPAPAWSSCFRSRESIPRFMSIGAATNFRAARHCVRLEDPPAVPPANLIQPTATGSPTVGSTLTAEPGTWSGTPPPTFSFRWQYQAQDTGWYDINGATSASYVVQPSDAGRLLRANVTGQNSAGPAEQVTKNIGPIGGAASGPVNISPPDISGTATVGGQLVADQGTWSGSPTSYGYQWQRQVGGDWNSINGATARAYTPSSADAGDQLRVTVTASNAAGQGSATSSATTAVTNPAQPPVNTTLPVISGKTVIGSTLTTTNGSWTGSPDDYGYQWQRSTASGGWSAISGATGSTYTATNADNGLLIRVEVTAQNDAGSAATTSTEVGPVTNPAGTCTVSSDTDTDGDGVPDCKEIAGFTLNVATTGTGSLAQRKVTSDPNNPDTDGDKISDGVEWQGFASDPTSADTDGDGLVGLPGIHHLQEPAGQRRLRRRRRGAELQPPQRRPAVPRRQRGQRVPVRRRDHLDVADPGRHRRRLDQRLHRDQQRRLQPPGRRHAEARRRRAGQRGDRHPDLHREDRRDREQTYKGSTTTTTDSTKTHDVDLTNVKTMNTNSTTLDVGGKGGVAKGKPYGEAHLNIKSTWQTGTVTTHQTGSTKDTVHAPSRSTRTTPRTRRPRTW